MAIKLIKRLQILDFLPVLSDKLLNRLAGNIGLYTGENAKHNNHLNCLVIDVMGGCRFLSHLRKVIAKPMPQNVNYQLLKSIRPLFYTHY